MLSKDNNDLITLTAAGTPGGEMMRRYWQPVALSAELPADAPLPVRIMGEDLVLFRDGDGRPALVGRRCPHRRWRWWRCSPLTSRGRSSWSH